MRRQRTQSETREKEWLCDRLDRFVIVWQRRCTKNLKIKTQIYVFEKNRIKHAFDFTILSYVIHQFRLNRIKYVLKVAALDTAGLLKKTTVCYIDDSCPHYTIHMQTKLIVESCRERLKIYLSRVKAAFFFFLDRRAPLTEGLTLELLLLLLVEILEFYYCNIVLTSISCYVFEKRLNHAHKAISRLTNAKNVSVSNTAAMFEYVQTGCMPSVTIQQSSFSIQR